jgi:hypothetical protein
MASKVLTNEFKENMCDGTVLTYGSLNENECDVITINVRGKIKAIENKKDYGNQSKRLKDNTIKHVSSAFDKIEWVNKHYIFTCDFTEKGIIYNKPFRFKYQVYIKPNTRQPLTAYKFKIMEITSSINTIISDECKKIGFEIIKETTAKPKI